MFESSSSFTNIFVHLGVEFSSQKIICPSNRDEPIVLPQTRCQIPPSPLEHNEEFPGFFTTVVLTGDLVVGSHLQS